MCGLYGYAFEATLSAKYVPQIRTLFATLTVANDSRGGDSWGWYGVNSKKLCKGVGDAGLMNTKRVRNALREPVLIAHTRKATTGKVIADNSHPFEVGELIGAHNGIVRNHADLNRRYGRTCSVDSQHLFHQLAEGLPHEEVEAYGAIAYAKRKHSNTVFLARFNNGELSVADVGMGYVFSSDKAHLRAALNFSELDYEMLTIEDEALYRMTPHVIEKVGMVGFTDPWSNADMKDWRSSSSYEIYDDDELQAMGLTAEDIQEVTTPPAKAGGFLGKPDPCPI